MGEVVCYYYLCSEGIANFEIIGSQNVEVINIKIGLIYLNSPPTH